MKIHKKGIVLTGGLIFSLLFLNMVQTQAKVTRTDFYTIEYLSAAPGDPERQWVEDGILHVRNQVYTFVIVEGELSGIVTFVSNVNVDLATGEGVGWGTNSFVGEWIDGGPLQGPIKWSGISVQKVSEFGTPTMKISGKFTSHGNSVAGQLLIKGYYERRGPPLGGTILAGEITSH